VCVPGMT